MHQIDEFVDDRQKTWCIHCARWIGSVETNRDHVPSKSLLLKRYPDNLPVVEICHSCNLGFSLDEEYVMTFLSCVLAGSTEPHAQQNPRVRSILQSQVSLKERIERAKTEYKTCGGKTRMVWKTETRRINRVVLKNARGHAFYEYGEPMLNEPAYIWSAPLQSLTANERINFENVGSCGYLPEVGSRMLTRTVMGQDLMDGWVIVQGGVYRYALVQQDIMLVRSVLFEYLATEVCWSC